MPTIENGSKHMQAVTYTGTGATQTISGLNFQPDLIWIKSRSAATDHKLTDSVRGVTKSLESNTTDAEATDANGVTAITSTGFTLGSDSVYNNSGATYVAWCWKAGEGSTSSNTAGSITSTVSANTSAGFSIVTYAGNGTTNATVGHGLGTSPAMIFFKCRDTPEIWVVHHQSLASLNNYLELNSTAAVATASNWLSKSSTTFGFPTFYNGTNASGRTYVAYCWSEIAGFSRFGSYIGNGSADGPFVYTGFRPKFVMWKRTDAGAHWVIEDTSRNSFNVANNNLLPSASVAEENTAGSHDFLSNGFKPRSVVVNETNVSGATYIYAAFAENPFKNSLAR